MYELNCFMCGRKVRTFKAKRKELLPISGAKIEGDDYKSYVIDAIIPTTNEKIFEAEVSTAE